MLPEPIIYDGLWRCLCPSFNAAPLYSTKALLRPRKRTTTKQIGTRVKLSTSRQRYSHGHIRGNQVITKTDEDDRKIISECGYTKGQKTKHNSNNDDDGDGGGGDSPTSIMPAKGSAFNKLVKEYLGSGSLQYSAKALTDVPEGYMNKSTQYLEGKLQELMVRSPSMNVATQILRCLIRDRHVFPQVRHYRALILANTDDMRGSPETVRILLSEMEKNRIPTDSGTLHAALQVGFLFLG